MSKGAKGAKRGSAAGTGAPLPWWGWLLLGVVFVGAGLLLYRGALRGPFITDDYAYIVQNPAVHELSPGSLGEILDPGGRPAARTTNYAPVHLLLHALEWRVFGPATPGYHVVNVVLHAVVAVLLVSLFLRAGVPAAGAVLGGAVFLVHPANVEAVAWIFQLKTIVSTGLAVGALLLRRRAPAVALALFALALLTKITAVFALPVALVEVWVRGDAGTPRRRELAWLAGWAGAFVAVGVAELAAFQGAGVEAPPPGVHVRTIVAIAMRYLVMATTSWGLATSHEPEPATSLLDPWWLGGLLASALVAWRLVVTLRRRDGEAVFWVLALAAWAPVSQVFPFRFPLADRYLYTILPGLIGAALMAARPALARVQAWLRRLGEGGGLVRPGPAAAAVVGVSVALTAGFAAHTAARAAVFRSGATVVLDAARRYPDGLQANLLRASRAAQEGDAEAVAAALRAMHRRGYSDFQVLLADPLYQPLAGHPAVRGALREMARSQAEKVDALEAPAPDELLTAAQAHALLDQPEEALRALDRALAAKTPIEPALRARMEALREGLALGLRARGAGPTPGGGSGDQPPPASAPSPSSGGR